MNSTKWETLTVFIKYLGKKGAIVADQTERGWFIQWIDRDPETLRRQALAEKRQKADKEEADDVSQATASVHDQADDDDTTQAGEVLAVEGTSEEQRRSSPLPTKPAVDRGRTPPVATTTRPATELTGRSRPLVRTPGRTGGARAACCVAREARRGAERGRASSRFKAGAVAHGAKMSALDQLMEQDKKRKAAAAAAEQVYEEEMARKDYWLARGIIVKILNKKVGGGKYYKKKARVSKVIERYVGEVSKVD
ncbi:unnamed protein product, partial [Heterosigma akashiwo]